MVFPIEHLLEKSTSMYFHLRLLVVVGGIFGDLLGKYPSAKTPDQQISGKSDGHSGPQNFKI